MSDDDRLVVAVMAAIACIGIGFGIWVLMHVL